MQRIVWFVLAGGGGRHRRHPGRRVQAGAARMVSAGRVLWLAAILAVAACGGSTPTSPTAPGGQASTLNLTGTWSGTIGRPLGELRIKTWTASQNGSAVSGAMVIDLDGGPAEVLITGSFTGTVSGTQLTAISFTVPANSIADIPACAFSGTGTLAATASTLSGSLSMTFPAPCVGDRLLSTTASATWPFSLAK